jgi:hypothetical protein
MSKQQVGLMMYISLPGARQWNKTAESWNRRTEEQRAGLGLMDQSSHQRSTNSSTSPDPKQGPM